jgi:hypothetical protein
MKSKPITQIRHNLRKIFQPGNVFRAKTRIFGLDKGDIFVVLTWVARDPYLDTMYVFFALSKGKKICCSYMWSSIFAESPNESLEWIFDADPNEP